MPGRGKGQSSIDKYSLSHYGVPGTVLRAGCISDQDQGWLVDQMLVAREHESQG